MVTFKFSFIKIAFINQALNINLSNHDNSINNNNQKKKKNV